ncbi:PREDICTED: embryonic protein DC-8-like [Populus euphratica]|uniref:Embryonic protein DC-8-like n=1 Tax=Populus euphratica TaxID=75702 RepID=A0AAJ6X5B5_POPEU|nr:PREDICTED: embryonic protein DC-8-like [Populus euphratica]
MKDLSGYNNRTELYSCSMWQDRCKCLADVEWTAGIVVVVEFAKYEPVSDTEFPPYYEIPEKLGTTTRETIFDSLGFGSIKDTIRGKLTTAEDIAEETKAARERGGTGRKCLNKDTGNEEMVIPIEENATGAVASILKASDQMSGQTFNDVGRMDDEGVIRVEMECTPKLSKDQYKYKKFDGKCHSSVDTFKQRGTTTRETIFDSLGFGSIKDTIRGKLTTAEDIAEETKAARERGGTGRKCLNKDTGNEEMVIPIEENATGAVASILKASDQMSGQTFNDVGRMDDEGVIRVEMECTPKLSKDR